MDIQISHDIIFPAGRQLTGMETMAMDALKRTTWLASGVLILTAIVLASLLGRVAWIQHHVSPEARERMAKEYTAQIPLMGKRKEIYFWGGEPAALSIRMYNLFVDPGFINERFAPEAWKSGGYLEQIKLLEKSRASSQTDTARAAIDSQIAALRAKIAAEMKDQEADIAAAKKLLVDTLSPLVKKPADDLLFEVEQNQFYKKEVSPGVWQDTDTPRRFLWLAKEVDDKFYDDFMKLRADMHAEAQGVLQAEGHGGTSASRNAAAEKAAMIAHALDGVGFVKSMKRVYPMGQLAGSVIGFANQYGGVDGLEHQFDDMLRGINGQMYAIKDAGRQTLLIADQRFTPADDGRAVWLTISAVIQGIAEDQLREAVEEHGAESGTAVVMDPYTGRILAIANYPFFDPQNFAKADPDSRRDRALTDPYEPGSIWKPFVLAWAIEKHIVKPTDVFDCRQGSYIDPTGRAVKDTHAVGMATVADILIKSSNIGMTQIGWKMGIPTLYEAVSTFGFGKRTGIELPGDQAGIVKPLSEWNKGTLTSVSFGYEVAATPLQLVRAFAPLPMAAS